MNIKKYLVSNEDDAKFFSNMLQYCWLDPNNGWENSQEILKYYLRTENYPFIDTPKNNQVSLYIAFSSRHEDLFNILISSKRLKNKNYSLKDLNRFMASDEGIENIIFSILEQISKKSQSCFDLSDNKAKKSFLQSASDYFVFNIENSFGKERDSLSKLDRFIEFTKCKFYKNENQILHNLLMMDIHNGFTHLYESLKNSTQKEMMLNFQRNPLNPTYSEETEEFLIKLKLKYSLENTLSKKVLLHKKNKI